MRPRRAPAGRGAGRFRAAAVEPELALDGDGQRTGQYDVRIVSRIRWPGENRYPVVRSGMRTSVAVERHRLG